MEQAKVEDDNSDFSVLTEIVRKKLTDKIVHVLVPNPDVNACLDSRMVELEEYATYLEKRAFERAKTRDEYYAILADIIFNMQKKLELRPTGIATDPYYRIPLSHELGEFMGLNHRELEEFDKTRPIKISFKTPVPPKTTLTREMRLHIVEKLGSMLFPPPDSLAKHDGRMDTITQKLRQIEAEAYEEAKDSDDYYNRASFKGYRLKKKFEMNGESYVEPVAKYPNAAYFVAMLGTNSLPELN